MTAGGVAVVTGASSGIGAAVAVALAARGMPLVLAGRDTARLAAVGSRTGAATVVADLARPGGVERVAAAVDGPVRLLVHAAGSGAAGPVADLAPADVADLVAANLVAPIQLTAALLPALRAGAGAVAFVASIAAVGVAQEAVYSATKAGLRGFADALRQETGLTVTTVLPAAVDTPFFDRRGVPYGRRFPRPVSAERVAAALIRGVERRRAEVAVPAWVGLAAWVHGAAPGTFARLSRRFAPTGSAAAATRGAPGGRRRAPSARPW